MYAAFMTKNTTYTTITTIISVTTVISTTTCTYNDNKSSYSFQFRIKDKDEGLLGKTCESNNDPHVTTFEGM